MPVDTRGACIVDTSESRCTAPGAPASRTGTAFSSTSVFQLPHAGQRPIQRGDS